jgi:hypothetical protein
MLIELQGVAARHPERGGSKTDPRSLRRRKLAVRKEVKAKEKTFNWAPEFAAA